MPFPTTWPGIPSLGTGQAADFCSSLSSRRRTSTSGCAITSRSILPRSGVRILITAPSPIAVEARFAILTISSSGPSRLVAIALVTCNNNSSRCPAAVARSRSARAAAATVSLMSMWVATTRISTPSGSITVSWVLCRCRSSPVTPCRIRYGSVCRPPTVLTSCHNDSTARRSSGGQQRHRKPRVGRVDGFGGGLQSPQRQQFAHRRTSRTGGRTNCCRTDPADEPAPTATDGSGRRTRPRHIIRPPVVVPSRSVTGLARTRNCRPTIGLSYSKSTLAPGQELGIAGLQQFPRSRRGADR